MEALGIIAVLLLTTVAGCHIGLHISPGYPIAGAVVGFIVGAICVICIGGFRTVVNCFCEAFDD